MDFKLIIKRMTKNPFFLSGFITIVIILILVVFGPLLIEYDPIKNSLSEKFISPESFKFIQSTHLMGTDQMGRDVFVRLLVGGRYSLLIAVIVVTIQTVIGTTLGLFSGFFGGVIDKLIMRTCDVFLAIPNLILAIAIMAVLGPNILNLVLVLAFSGWVQFCKVTRNNVMVIKNQEFISASRVLGAKNGHIIFTQIFPNITTHIIILASQSIGVCILVEAALSFLSLGVQPPIPSWGNMISTGRIYMTTYPWLVFAPGITLMITVLAFNFLGDGLRDVLDPKRRS